MLLGTMNHPAKDIFQEIEWISEMGFEFLDLTLEPPRALAQALDASAICRALKDNNLGVVGHTAYYLPLCSPFESIRKAAVEELKYCLEFFAELGTRWMNLHPDRQAPMHERKFIIDRNIASIRDLLPLSRELGVGLMIENLPGSFNTARQVSELLDPIPELGLHLDIGHSNLLAEPNTADELLAGYGKRLRHVHMHDNKGGSADLHLPLGSGTIDTRYYVRLLQRTGYNGTITLEVFTPDKRHVAYSMELLREVWDECEAVNRVPVLPQVSTLPASGSSDR
jgi:sugar phosphate isomerase/epimerase